jgi:hypothetical protein
MSHEHAWRKTGQYFATIPPTYIYACDGCRSIGQAHEGEPVSKVARIDDQETWARYYAPDTLTRRHGSAAFRDKSIGGKPWEAAYYHLLTGIKIMAPHLDPKEVERVGREAEEQARIDGEEGPW